MYPHLEKSLIKGHSIHAFRSGGGLRVVRVENKQEKGELVGYGEHYDIKEAFRHADEDISQGKRKYEDVYGKLYPHYLTGSCDASCKLDLWLLRGYAFDIMFDGKEFIFKHEYTKDIRTPQEVVDRVSQTGKAESWFYKGRRYFSHRIFFANGEAGCSSKCMYRLDNGLPELDKNYIDEWTEPRTITFSAKSLEKLLEKAEIELDKELTV